MKKTTAILCVMCLWAIQGFAQPAYPASSLEGEALKTFLKQNWFDTGDDKHITIGYSSARRAMYSYVDAESDGKVYCVYTGFNQPSESTTFLDPINAEHTVPQSFFGSSDPMQSDIHHLFPTHGSVNSSRSNNPLGEIADTSTDVWYTVNTTNTGLTTSSSIPTSNIDAYSESRSNIFEPKEDHKGNAARAIFYFYTMYPTQAGSITSVGDMNTLYQWHLDDPVDDQERTRNNRAAERQGNYNPYINHPELLAKAWGLAPSNPTAGFSTSIASTLEGQSGTKTFQIQIRVAPSPTSNVTLSVEDDNSGTATAGTDYSFSTQNLTFTSSQTTQMVNVTVNGDADPEGNETLVLKITNLAGNGGDISLGTSTHTLTIIEDDGFSPAITSLSTIRGLYSGTTDVTIADETYIEGVITSVSDNTNNQNIVVQDDFAGIVLRFDFPHSFVRGEKVRVDMGNVSIGNFNDLVQVAGVSMSDVEILESNASLPSYQTITINQLNNDGAEYESELIRIEAVTFPLADGSATFSNGTTIMDGGSSATFYVGPSASFSTEIVPAGTGVVLGIGGVFSGSRQLIPQVFAEDIFPTGTTVLPALTLSVSPSSIAENGGVTTLTATLSETSTSNVTVNLSFSGTATSDTDYSASATSITIVAGSTSGTATITGTDDSEVEGDEIALVDISSASNATESGVQQVSITILDDDIEEEKRNLVAFLSGLTQMKSIEDFVTVGHDILPTADTVEIAASSSNLVYGVDYETSPAILDGKITLLLSTNSSADKIKVTSLTYKNGQVVFQLTETSNSDLEIGSIDLHTVNLSGITGTETDLAQLGFSFFPNPTKEGVNIKFDNFKSNFEIELFSLEGKKVSTFQINQPQQFVEFPALSSGLYILKVNLNDQSYFERVIVE